MVFARATIAGLAAMMLVAAGEPAAPPADLEPYVKDGHFEPGDFGWARGAFADATPEQREAFAALSQWAEECRTAAREEAIAELAAMGIDAATLSPFHFAQRCLVMLPQFDMTRPFAEFEAALREARPIADTYFAAARLAQTRALGNAATAGDALTAHTTEEQMLRFAMSWGRDPLTGVPELSPDGQAALRTLVGIATGQSDAANTEWLKTWVAKDGWPTISQVGEKGASAAWLLTQHADADPVFQARALRLMEPLVAQGEVSKQNYAYLYDRIMLKLTGKQRYGTQWSACQGDTRPLQPLEDEPRLAELRAEMGLDPIEDYARSMDQMFGPCSEKKTG